MAAEEINDVLRVYELQADLLDVPYIESWLKELHLEDLWQRVLTEADPFIPPDDTEPEGG